MPDVGGALTGYVPTRLAPYWTCVVVAEGWPAWLTFLPSLGFHILCVYAPSRQQRHFDDLRQYDATSWKNPNCLRKDLPEENIWLFVSGGIKVLDLLAEEGGFGSGVGMA